MTKSKYILEVVKDPNWSLPYRTQKALKQYKMTHTDPTLAVEEANAIVTLEGITQVNINSVTGLTKVTRND